MTDESPGEQFGPGWWKATDKRWYPPPERPDRSPPPGVAEARLAAAVGTYRLGDGRRSVGSWLVWIVGGVVVVAVLIAAVLDGGIEDGGDSAGGDGRADSSSDTSDPELLQLTAFNVCKDFVKDRLRAPATASFRNFFEDDGEVRVIGTGSGPYTIRSSVDSENGFGANLRTDFVCEVRKTEGENWRLVDLHLME